MDYKYIFLAVCFTIIIGGLILLGIIEIIKLWNIMKCLESSTDVKDEILGKRFTLKRELYELELFFDKIMYLMFLKK